MQEDKVREELLESANWGGIILKLIHHVIWRAQRYTLKFINRDDCLQEGKSPADIALGAIEKVLTGTRSWSPDKYPNLLAHLMWVADSDLQHLFSSAEHKKSGRMPETISATDLDGEKEAGQETTLNAVLDPETPERQVLAKEQSDFEQRLKTELYSLVEGDEDLEMLLLCFEEGLDKEESIAKATGWEITKVYNLKRKVLRKAAKLKELFLNESGTPKEIK
ncbi:MAG: hypothetical protein A3K30_06745 [Deltaproteobacteria bacterium RBG_13_51_10]|nr:MAG: hypothetical protein A3K30_06745 [Deltaproteobacteria bacterium RBG_13_51_10]